jgi:NhaP-type Na+/H+ and K+/H+ antiporter
MSNHVPPPKKESVETGYDRSEPLTIPILLNIIAIVVILGIVIAGVTYYFNAYRDRIIEQTQLMPVSQDLLDLRAKEDQLLNSYGIADKAAGTVRVPVSRAMELVIAEAKAGTPKYPTKAYAVKKIEDVVVPPAAPDPNAPAK